MIHGNEWPRATKAARRVRPKLRSYDWFFENVAELWYEWPQGPSSAKVALIAGAMLASIPNHVATANVAVGTWRKQLTGHGNVTKEAVNAALLNEGYELPPDAPLDAWEALGIAVVCRRAFLGDLETARSVAGAS
jgi:hypothetical protein